MAVKLHVKVRERGLGQAAHNLYTHSVCDTKAPMQLQYAVVGAILVLHAFA